MADEQEQKPDAETPPAPQPEAQAEETPATPAAAAPAEDAPKAETPASTGDDAPAAPARKRDAVDELLGADDVVEAPKRKIKGKFIPRGVVHIKATFNNTQVSISDPQGNVVSWSSSGRAGFKGSRKSTAFAASTVAQNAARGAVAYGMQEVEVRVQGPGAGRESAIRAIQAAGLNVTAIRDVTPIPHNGCRPRKRRRV